MNFVLTCWDLYNRLPLTGWLKQQEFTSYYSGSQKVQDQDAGMQLPVKVLFLACRWLSYCHVFTESRGRALVSLPLLLRAPALLDQGFALMTSFNPYQLLTGLVSNIVTLGVRASKYEFGGSTVQSIIELSLNFTPQIELCCTKCTPEQEITREKEEAT